MSRDVGVLIGAAGKGVANTRRIGNGRGLRPADFNEDAANGEALRAAGAAVDVDVVSGAVDGFEAWAPHAALAREKVARAHAWRGRIAGIEPGSPLE